MLIRKIACFICVYIYFLIFSTGQSCMATVTDTSINISQPTTTTKNTNFSKKLNLSSVELANTAEKRGIGLMFKRELCKTCSMLFEFDSPEIAIFWMKNTYISLDIIFINEQGLIDNISYNTTPLREDIFYTSKNPVKYILEVNSGYCQANNLKSGDYLDINYLKNLAINKT